MESMQAKSKCTLFSFIPAPSGKQRRACCCATTTTVLALLALGGLASIGTVLGLKYSGHKISKTAFGTGIGLGTAATASAVIGTLFFTSMCLFLTRKKSANYSIYHDS